MAYFLKKSKQHNRTYLAIYESFYSPDSNDTRQKCIQSLGSVESLKENGIEDPINFYKKQIAIMNEERKSRNANKKFNQKLISDVSPEKYLGYFPLCNILNTLDVEQHFDFMQSTTNFKFSVFDVFSSLVYARTVAPLSKYRTFHDILPSLYKDINFSYDQLLEAVEFVGSEYEKFVEIFTVATHDNYGTDTSHTYFDCTNFYFEIDKETDFQKKGPSKEFKKDPIVGLGLLLDANMIPIGMKMYPGNESEMPVLRYVITSLKKQNNISGRTIQIADKGLNCARNIIEAKNNKDGYIFSKSIKKLSEKEQKWVFNENNIFTDVLDKNNKIRYSYTSCIDEFEYSYTDDDTKKTYRQTVKEKRVLTFSPKLQRKKLIEIDKMVEKAKKLRHAQAKKEEYGESSRYVKFTDENGKKANVILDEEAIEKDRKYAGYNLLVTSEYNMSDEEIYNAYHNLWRIEESFKVMKSELDARPVYLHKENCIKGHFLICYVSVLLIRLFQFKILENRYSTSSICKFIKEFRVVKISENRYINMTRASDFITDLAAALNQPITNYYLTEKQIKMMHSR